MIHAQFEDLTCLEFIELLFTLLFSQHNCAFVLVTETDDRLKTVSPSEPMQMWSMDRHQCAHGVVQHAKCPSRDTYGNKTIPNFSRTVVQIPFKLPHQRLQVTFHHDSLYFFFFQHTSRESPSPCTVCKAQSTRKLEKLVARN